MRINKKRFYKSSWKELHPQERARTTQAHANVLGTFVTQLLRRKDLDRLAEHLTTEPTNARATLKTHGLNSRVLLQFGVAEVIALIALLVAYRQLQNSDAKGFLRCEKYLALRQRTCGARILHVEFQEAPTCLRLICMRGHITHIPPETPTK